MTCETALLLISGHIDGVNTEAEEAELQAHLSECAACRAVLAAFEDAEAGVKELETAPPEGFARGVMYRIGQQAGTEKKPRRRFFGPGTAIGAVAAILVLMLGTGLIPLGAKSAAPESAADKAPMQLAETESMRTAQADHNADAYGSAWDAPAAPVPAPEEHAELDDGFWAEEKTVLRDAVPSKAAEPTAIAEMPMPTEPEPMAVGMELCKQLDAPVLSYTEFGTELIDLLRQYAPELGGLLAALTPERTADGRLLYRTDTRTVLALHEWLLGQLPHTEGEDENVQQAETELMLRTQELDPNFGFVAEVITLPETPERIVWPEIWPEDWAERYKTEQSWALCFPTAEKVPLGSETAYLVLCD